MTDFLTPAQIDGFVSDDWTVRGKHLSLPFVAQLAATLREMAAVVEAVAEGNQWVADSDYGTICAWCHAGARCVGVGQGAHWEAEHSPDCTYLRARKLRGEG